jgi:hypothetical protein
MRREIVYVVVICLVALGISRCPTSPDSSRGQQAANTSTQTTADNSILKKAYRDSKKMYEDLVDLDTIANPTNECSEYARMYGWSTLRIGFFNAPDLGDSLGVTLDDINDRLRSSLIDYIPLMMKSDPVPGSGEESYIMFSRCDPDTRFLRHIHGIRSLAQGLNIDLDSIGLSKKAMRKKVLSVMTLEIKNDQRMGGNHWLWCECDEEMIGLFTYYKFNQDELNLTPDEWSGFMFGPPKKESDRNAPGARA